MKILLLGGTTEASGLARHLAGLGWDATLSLAGRTRVPAAQPIPVRSGGFGGASGLAAYLREHQIEALVDATHPFAAQMKRNAVEAARTTLTPSVAIVRPPWVPTESDRWQMVADMPAAAAALGATPRRVLLTVGQKELAPFIVAAEHRYVVRSVEPPDALPPGAEFVGARGPFREVDERDLLLAHRIEVIVTKNSGGSATYAKLEAARALGVDVIMVERPALPMGLQVVRTSAAALAWLMFHAGTVRGE